MSERTSGPKWPVCVSAAALLIVGLLAPQAWKSTIRDEDAWSHMTVGHRHGTVSSVKGLAAVPELLEAPIAAEAPTRPPVADRVSVSLDAGQLPPTPDDTRPGRWQLVQANRQLLTVEDTGLGVQLPVAEGTGDIGWPVPASLIEELEQSAEVAACRQWSQTVQRDVRALFASARIGTPAADALLAGLTKLASQPAPPQLDMADPQARVPYLTARYALERRLSVWTRVHRLMQGNGIERSALGSTSATWEDTLASLRATLGRSPRGMQWRRYLKLDAVDVACNTEHVATTAASRSHLAVLVLDRLHSADLTANQQRFLQRPEFRVLSHKLRHWVTRPVDYRRLLFELERFELRPTNARGAYLVAASQVLRWSTTPDVARLGQHLDARYRNANIRLAVSRDFLQRVLPQSGELREPVRDRILGARVWGRSRIKTNLNLHFLPAPDRWQLVLAADGRVSSETGSTKGPATFFHLGRSRYQVAKPIHITPAGIRTSPSVAAVANSTDLRSMETAFDEIPLLNIVARSMVMQQYDSQRHQANGVVEGRLARKARQRLDEEVARAIAEAEGRFQKKIMVPVRRLQLDPQTTQLETTADRLTLRARLAGVDQIGSYSPRPRAPKESLLSVQVNQSVINNAIGQLKLDGRDQQLRELYREVHTALGSTNVQIPEDLHEQVTVHLAAEDAVRITCDEGTVTVTIRIRRLASGRRHVWRNFVIRAYYESSVDGLSARLSREKPISVESRRLRFGDRVAIRAIFSKAFARSKALQLVPEAIRTNPRLQDLRVTQLEIRDGWIGLALGRGPVYRTAGLNVVTR